MSDFALWFSWSVVVVASFLAGYYYSKCKRLSREVERLRDDHAIYKVK